MGSHRINLGVRFVLEIAALVAFAQWGWIAFGSGFQWAAVIAAPAAAAAWAHSMWRGIPAALAKRQFPFPGRCDLV